MSLAAVASNPFERYKGIGKPDERKERKTEAPIPGLEGLLGKYKTLLDESNDAKGDFVLAKELITEVLTPDDINRVIPHTIPYEQHRSYSRRTGAFLSRLVQNSFNAGYNKFHLDVRQLARGLGRFYDLEGEEKFIDVTVEGNVGEYFGARSELAVFNLNGNTGDWCGDEAHKCVFNIAGNVGDDLGDGVHRSKFTIKGNVGDFCASRAGDSFFYFYGKLGRIQHRKDSSPARSTFIVYTRKQYEALLRKLPKKLPKPDRNKAVLADSTGKFLETRIV